MRLAGIRLRRIGWKYLIVEFVDGPPFFFVHHLSQCTFHLIEKGVGEKTQGGYLFLFQPVVSANNKIGQWNGKG